MHALRVFDMRMHDFDMRMHDFDMQMHVFGCTRCVFSTCECMILTCKCMFSMYVLHVFHAIDGMLTCRNMTLNPKTGIESNTEKTRNRDWNLENAIFDVRKVRMAGAKTDLPTLVFSSKHMFTYRHFAIDSRTAYSP